MRILWSSLKFLQKRETGVKKQNGDICVPSGHRKMPVKPGGELGLII